MSDFKYWLDNHLIDRNISYLEFVRDFQNYLFMMFKNYKRIDGIEKTVNIGFRLNHNMFLDKTNSVRDHLSVCYKVIKTLRSF